MPWARSATPAWLLTTKGARLAGAAGGLAAGVAAAVIVALGLAGGAPADAAAEAAAAAATTAAAAARFVGTGAAAGLAKAPATPLPGDGAGPLPLLAGPSNSCFGAKREGRTDVLNFSDSVGLLPTASPPAAAIAVLPCRSTWALPSAAAPSVAPKLLVSPTDGSRELVRGISPLSSVLIAARVPCRRGAAASPAALGGWPPLPGLWLPTGCLLVAAKGEAATGSAMRWYGDPGCCREQPDSEA